MFSKLTSYIQNVVDLNDQSMESIRSNFKCGNVEKGAYFYEYGSICRAIYFINEGAVRHLHYDEDGNEVTCDFTFENNFLTDYNSFRNEVSSSYLFVALEPVKHVYITKERLEKLYISYPELRKLAQKEAESIALKVTKMAQSLITYKAEKRYLDLMKNQSNIIHRVPQKYVASYIGIAPESLSRIRKKVSRR